MSAIFRCRTSLRSRVVPAVLGSAAGAFVVLPRRQLMRLDTLPPATSPNVRSYSTGPSEKLNPETIKQLSSGSLAGFCLGVLVSFFSRTLVFFVGLGIVGIQFASRYGIDVLDQLKLKKRIQSSRVLSRMSRNPVFTLCFGATFALASFASF